jgi:serine/threonine protein kinase
MIKEFVQNKLNGTDAFGNQISPNLSKFFTRCLDNDPDNRATIDEALTLLQQCLS